MKILSAADVARLSPYHDIVEALREGFRTEIATPVRHHHEIPPVFTTTVLRPVHLLDQAGINSRVETDEISW